MPVIDGSKKVLLVDDFHVCRTFFAEGLRRKAGLLVSEAAHSEGLPERIEAEMPDVIVLNLSMHHCSGMLLLQEIHRKFPKIGVLGISYLHHNPLYAERTICAGAAGYISVHEEGECLLSAVDVVAAGGVYLSAELHRKIHMESGPQRSRVSSPFDRLSLREFEVFCLTGHGYVPKRIAEKLRVSVKTVETYRERIREKLGFSNGGDLLLHASHYIREQSHL